MQGLEGTGAAVKAEALGNYKGRAAAGGDCRLNAPGETAAVFFAVGGRQPRDNSAWIDYQ